MRNKLCSRLLTLVVTVVLAFALVTPSVAQRRGSFGGGGRSFGGGGMSRSFGGGGGGSSFNRGGSFGGGSRSYSSPSSGFNRSNSSSFGRTGAFGNSGRVNSTSMRGPSAYRGISPVATNRYYYGGMGYRSYYYGGYGDYWYHPMWYYWMPFHPAFYYNPPYMYGGEYYPGGFSFTRLLIGIVVILFILWLISLIFRGGGGKSVRYTSYR